MSFPNVKSINKLSGNFNGNKVVIEKKEDDPEALRASIGGRKDKGYYLVFRGDDEEIIMMLHAMTGAFRSYINYKKNNNAKTP